MDLYLREATYADRDLLFEWANDSTVRHNSFNTEPISYEIHVKWFDRIMSDEKVMQYILCSGNEPVGQIRISIEGSTGCIGYSISADNRGKGFGECILKLAAEKVKEDNAAVKSLLGEVKYENIASARAFEKCGFNRTDKKEYIEFSLNLL